MRSLGCLALIFCCITGVKTIELYFSSYNCDEEPRFMTTSKIYNITWYGQKTPHLCSFSFSTGEEHQQICFESLLFDLSSLSNGVIVKIKNNTRQLWEFDRYDSAITKTCVMFAKRLNISINLPSTYQEPPSSEYLILQITAEAIDYTIAYIVAGTIAGIMVAIFIFCAIAMFCQRSDSNCLDGICEVIGSFCKCLLTCALCRLIKEKVDCDCNVRDCYDDVRTRLNECTTCNNSQQRESEISNTFSEEPTRPTNTEDTIQHRHSDIGSRTISSATVYEPHEASSPELPPPSYDDVMANARKTPSAPPPSYSEV